MNRVKKTDHCRISGDTNLVSVLNLGKQSLTGHFPRSKDEVITAGPLELVWCPSSGLLQLSHSYEPEEMYGENYGYRSGLNSSMVSHLHNKVKYLTRFQPINSGDVVLDIGSNDGTLLSAYDTQGLVRFGVDPVGEKFRNYYPNDVLLIPDFFNNSLCRDLGISGRVDIITSIAMFYDLESPLEFVADIREALKKDGIWHFEQSYMPSMLRMNSYDTVCHEHLEYYSLGVVKKLLESGGLKILDVQMNGVNGGSFAVTAAHVDSAHLENKPLINWMLGQEDRMGLQTPKPYRDFEERVFRHRDDLVRLIHSLNADGKTVVGYGASTKGNVLLQFCGFDENDIKCIAEVNSDKFGCFTPGTRIPILPEAEVREMQPDYMLVLPWHFKDSIIKKEAEYLASGGKLIFPMPEIEII